jgi:hypothetical protein
MEWTLAAALATSLPALMVPTAIAFAEPEHWETYSIAETRTSVDIPTSIFTEKMAGHLDGYGERLQTADGRAELTVQTAPNSGNEAPAAFLARRHPPADIQYKRVTDRFFAVSGYKRDQVYYSRCNFSRAFVHCITLNYPAQEERNWDAVVTRISLSLRGE